MKRSLPAGIVVSCDLITSRDLVRLADRWRGLSGRKGHPQEELILGIRHVLVVQ